MNLRELLEGDREVSSAFHVSAAQAWAKEGLPKLSHSHLVYSALEYRCAIERIVLELCAVLDVELPGPEELSRPEQFKSLVARLTQSVGGDKKKLYRTLLFNRILSSFILKTRELAMPDVGELHKHWLSLSLYCHHQMFPAQSWGSSQWVRNGYDCLGQVDTFLKTVFMDFEFGGLPDSGLPLEVLRAKKDFISEDLDERGLRVRLKLMEPVLQERFRRRVRR